MMDEMELVGRFGEVDPLPIEALDRAEAVLRAAMAETLPPALLPVTGRCHRRRPNRRSRASIAAVAVAVACAAGGFVIAGSGSTSSPTNRASGSGGTGHAVPAVLTARKVRLISSQSAAALADSGTAVETTTNTIGSSAQGPPTTIDVTFSGQNVNYLISSNGNGAEGVQNRVVGGQLYLYINGPDLQMHWYHDTEPNAAASASFPDPRTLLQAVSPAAGLENLGRQSVDGLELTHLRATTPGSIGQLGIPDVSGTVTSFEVWVDSADVVRQMAVSSSDGTACEVVPGTAVGSSNTINVNGETKVRVGVSCGTSQTLGSNLEVRFANLGAPETVTAPIGAIDQQAKG